MNKLPRAETMTRFLHNTFKGRDDKAFPGDTYLTDLQRAAKVGEPWAKWLIVAVIFGFFADLYFLHDTVDIAFDNASGSFLSLYCWVVAATLVLLYLFIGHVAGKKLRNFKVFRIKSNLASGVVALTILVVSLFALTFFRLSTELDVSVMSVVRSFFSYLASGDYVIEVSKVFVMTLVMLLSAFVSALHAYYGGDAVSEAVYRESLASLPADRALYNKVFFERSNNVKKEREYEAQERELDKRAVESAFKLGSIASQLNGMVDPADAYEFLEAQRAIAADYFSEGAR